MVGQGTLPAILALAALPLLSPQETRAAPGIEMPRYEVLASGPAPASMDGPVELRRYAPMIVAEITVTAPDRDTASSRGFMPLARYIFGQNRPEDKIAMTAPVTTAPAQGLGGPGEKIAMTAPVTTAPTGEASKPDRYTVRFMMPSEYTMETLPEPLDPSVRLEPVPGRILAALRFVGDRSKERVAGAEAVVRRYMQENGLTPAGPFATAGYDGPDTPASRRRWEVQRPVVSAAPVTGE